jgi:predicted RNase H-like nuclease
MTAFVAGADGCRGGWVCVLRRTAPPFEEQIFLAKTISEAVFHTAAPAIIAIDIPIGLPDIVEGAGRACDAAARGVLGKRGASVFAIPARAAFSHSDNYRNACAAAAAHSIPPRRISQQTFRLFPKILEVDSIMTPALQLRVFECHPELAFWAMSGGTALPGPKKLRGRQNEIGLAHRRALLATYGFAAAILEEKHFPASVAGTDDVLDACACAWTAGRIFNGEAMRYPENPVIDSRGLRMEIWA